MNELESLLAAGGVDDAALRARLAEYAALVLEANRSFNLTGAKSAAEFVPHVLDSLTVAPLVRSPLIDIGSGAGLPAIPIALATGAVVTMVESTVKKARFLESLLARFALSGAVVPRRAEVAAHEPELRERFTTGTARAVSSAPTVAELLVPFLAIGGEALLQRGTMDARERTALDDAALMLGATVSDERMLDGGERRIVVLRKTAPTPLRFPRRTGIPEKRPLCL